MTCLARLLTLHPFRSPHPSWEVVADLSLDLPYPLWYMKYIMLHPSLCGTLLRPPSLPAEDRSVPVDGWGESAGRQLRHELVPHRSTNGPEGRSVLPAEPYPRQPTSPPSEETAAGVAHLPWMRVRPWRGGGGGRNVLWLPQDPPQELDAWDPVARFLLSIGACGCDPGGGSSSIAKCSWGVPDYSAVLCDDILDPASWLGGPAMAAGVDPAVLLEQRRQRRVGKRGQEREQQESAPWLWNPEQRQLQQRASAALRLLLGDDYEAIMARLPQPGKRRGKGSNARPPVAEQDGTGFLRGDRFTLNATLFYSVDWLGGCVDCVGLAFGAVHGAAAEPAEVADVYLAELGLLSWALEREAAAGNLASQE